MKCKCGYDFVFHPKADLMTDERFLSAIRRASANGTQYFTKNQLYLELCKPKDRATAFNSTVVMSITVAYLLTQPTVSVAKGVVVVACVAALLWLFLPRPNPPTQRRFDDWLAIWDDKGKKIEKLVEEELGALAGVGPGHAPEQVLRPGPNKAGPEGPAHKIRSKDVD